MTDERTNPLRKFLELPWSAAKEHETVLTALVSLENAKSPWPTELKRQPRECLWQVFQACTAYSDRTLTVRSLDPWLVEDAKDRDAEPVRSGYHRLSGRLGLERSHAAAILDCFFKRWGALPGNREVTPTPHGWTKGERRYFGLPVHDKDAVRNRVVNALFPQINRYRGDDYEDEDLVPKEGVHFVVGRYEVILGTNSAWAMQAFLGHMRTELESPAHKNAKGALVFVVDLGRRIAHNLQDYESFRNVLKLYAALATLRLFRSEAEDPRHPSDGQRRTSAWSHRAAAAIGDRTKLNQVWDLARKHIAVAVRGLPADLKAEFVKKTSHEVMETSPVSQLDSIESAMRQASEVELDVTDAHIFPGGSRPDLVHAIEAAGVRDLGYLTMSVTVGRLRNEIDIQHCFYWATPPGADLPQGDRIKGGPSSEASGSVLDVDRTSPVPFLDQASETGFWMLQEAAALRLGGHGGLDEPMEARLKSYAYMSSKVDLVMLNLDEFMSVPGGLLGVGADRPEDGRRA